MTCHLSYVKLYYRGDYLWLQWENESSNSGKKWAEQPRIAKEVLHSCRHSNDVKKLVKGLMIESYIEDGSQKPEECTYGKSITDPCLGWVKTEKLIYDLAELL